MHSPRRANRESRTARSDAPLAGRVDNCGVTAAPLGRRDWPILSHGHAPDRAELRFAARGKRPDAVTRPLDPACVAIRGSTRLVVSLRPGAAPAAVSVRWRFAAATTVPRALSALRSAETRSPGEASHKKEGAHPSAPKFPETT
jgi:hypothetical protein